MRTSNPSGSIRSQRAHSYAFLAVLLCSACAGADANVARVQAGLIGLQARTLRTCLGDAPFFEIREDGSEIWGYAFNAPSEQQGDIEFTRASGRGTAFQRPQVTRGAPTERDGGDNSAALESRKAGFGQCLHVFRVADGVVQSYTGRGRTVSGLNANTACTIALDRCVPEVTQPPAATMSPAK